MANEEIAERLWEKILNSDSVQGEHLIGSVWAGKIGNCVRRTYYELILSPPDDEGVYNPISSLVMGFGNMFEDLLTKKIIFAAKDGVFYRGKKRVADHKLKITGETDPIVEFEGHTIILEMKATHRDHYRVVVNKYKNKEYDEGYYNQIQTYLHLTPEADFGILVVANRDMRYEEKSRDAELPPVLIMPIERDNNWRRINWERIRNIHRAVEDRIPPDRPYVYSDWHCTYCPFKVSCWTGITLNDAEQLDTKA